MRALRIFKRHFELEKVGEKLIKEIFSQYSKLRDGEVVRKDAISTAIEIFSVIGLTNAEPRKVQN